MLGVGVIGAGATGATGTTGAVGVGEAGTTDGVVGVAGVIAGVVGAVGGACPIGVPSISRPDAMGSVELGASPAAMTESMKIEKAVLSLNKFVMATTGVVSSVSSEDETLKTIWNLPRPAELVVTLMRSSSTCIAVAAAERAAEDWSAVGAVGESTTMTKASEEVTHCADELLAVTWKPLSCQVAREFVGKFTENA